MVINKYTFFEYLTRCQLLCLVFHMFLVLATIMLSVKAEVGGGGWQFGNIHPGEGAVFVARLLFLKESLSQSGVGLCSQRIGSSFPQLH